MIYYQYITKFKDPYNQDSTLILTRSCEDLDYDAHFEETKIIAKQTMKQACKGVIPVFTENTVMITLTQYNTLIKGPDDLEINPDIPIENDENV